MRQRMMPRARQSEISRLSPVISSDEDSISESLKTSKNSSYRQKSTSERGNQDGAMRSRHQETTSDNTI